MDFEIELTSPDLERTLGELSTGVSGGLFTGAQLFVSLRGAVAADVAVGEARVGVPMTPASIVEWASATKAVTCSAVGRLWNSGAFGLDDRVCDYVPEFGQNGKRDVTIRHLLTHTGGLTDSTTEGASWEECIAVCASPLQRGWQPGHDYGYNSVGMWMLAEIVRRATATPFSNYLQSEFFEPLGMAETWLRMPANVYRRTRERIAELPGHELSGTEAWVRWGRPTGGIHGPIGDLGRFYAALLAGRVLPPPVREAMTARHLCGVVDRNLNVVVDRGLGFALASSFPGHSYGPYASSRSYGHGGGSWCTGFADPEHDLAVAAYWNGRLSAADLAVFVPALLRGLYEDLQLVRGERR